MVEQIQHYVPTNNSIHRKLVTDLFFLYSVSQWAVWASGAGDTDASATPVTTCPAPALDTSAAKRSRLPTPPNSP